MGYDVLRDSATTIVDKFLPNLGSRLNHLDRSVELLRKHHNFATPNSVSANTHVTHVIECWSVMQTSQFIQFSVDGFLILTPKILRILTFPNVIPKQATSACRCSRAASGSTMRTMRTMGSAMLYLASRRDAQAT